MTSQVAYEMKYRETLIGGASVPGGVENPVMAKPMGNAGAPASPETEGMDR